MQVNECKSSITKTLRGLAQGGCISSLAFAIYINDLHTSIQHSDLVLFADDSQTGKEVSISNVQRDMEALQTDCTNIVRWFTENDLELNASKSELIVHSSKKNKHIALSQFIYISGCKISCSENVKSLGLIKDQLLNWDAHIDHVTKKSQQVTMEDTFAKTNAYTYSTKISYRNACSHTNLLYVYCMV